MDTITVIFWMVLFSCLVGLYKLIPQLRATGRGWLFVYLVIMAMAIAGVCTSLPVLVAVSGGMWLLFILAPALLSLAYRRHASRQQFARARQIAQIIRWLHPADGWHNIPSIMHAEELAERGDTPAAFEILERIKNGNSPAASAAKVHLFRLRHQWRELLAWLEPQLARNPALLPVALRAVGETGDTAALLQLYERNQKRIEKLAPRDSVDFCRLFLFAFCGRPESVAAVLGGKLARLPASTREFWLATAELAAGATEAGKTRFERLLPLVNPLQRELIQTRLAGLDRLLFKPDSAAEKLLADAAREQGHEARLAPRVSVLSRGLWAARILIFLNLAMFGVEIYTGGSTNLECLYKLGALWTPAVVAGEWWRLLAAQFLHLGVLHLLMNMLALAWLGPIVENSFGTLRFLVIYLLAGTGSMGFVLFRELGAVEPTLLVGASGCIMGLIGAMAASLWRGWRVHHARIARLRLRSVIAIVLMQTTFDLLVPQVSMAAHLTGIFIGFVTALALRDKTETPPARATGTTEPPPAPSA